MRLATVLIIILFMSFSCGKDLQTEELKTVPAYSATACQNSPALGSWTSSIGSTLTVTQDCHYTNTGCGSVGIFPPLTQLNGYAEIYVETKSSQAPSICMNTGFNNCYYQIMGEQMIITCGNTQGIYTKSGGLTSPVYNIH